MDERKKGTLEMDDQHILLVASAYNGSRIQRLTSAIELFRDNGAQFSLLYNIPQIPAYYYQIPSMQLLQQHLMKDAHTNIKRIGELLSVPPNRQWIEISSLKNSIVRTAEKLEADFSIVISEHKEKSLIPETTSKELEALSQAVNF